MSASQVAPQVTLAGTLAGTLVIAAVIYLIEQKMTRDDLYKEKTKLYNNGILLASIVVWPWVFSQVVGFNQLQGKMWFPFLWPTLLIVYAMAQNTAKESPETAFQRHNEIKSNANGLIAAAFALGTLLSVVQGNQSKEGAQVLMISLLMCIGFLLPSPMGSPTSYKAAVVRTGQQSVFHMALGLFMSGIFLSWKT